MNYIATFCPQRFVRATICPCNILSMRRFVHATFFLQRIVRDEMSATICPRPFVLQPFVLRRFVHATNCPQRFVRDDLSCDILSGHQEIKYEERYKVFFCLFHINSDIVYPATFCPVTLSAGNALTFCQLSISISPK
jgi:hypothetical protein